MPEKKFDRGFSLIEMLMAVCIMTVVATMLYTIFQTSVRIWDKSNAKMEVIQSARIFFDRLSTDLESAVVNPDKNMNFHMFERGILFVNKGLYHNGSTLLHGYQEIGYAANSPVATDIDFTNDTVEYFSRHSLSGSGFQFESNFATLAGSSSEQIINCVAQFKLECWNHLTGEWMDWNSWPGSPADPYWNVMTPISLNDPDMPSPQPNDPSNKGRMPEKIRVTLKLVPPDIAKWINLLTPGALSSFTQGQTGTTREKVIAELAYRKILKEYTHIIRLPETPK
ncbi:MAG: prepilin-type N-terminal cleavage/methylation domain-containing protein [Candidatus Auribacterota bacterium]|jgi:prepilin-type N-terminal cleavage/methylation domain-containing protein|nr:prepilin-type N-terminal cleavage/methylation domain-containing protein [Candidatus Auribacterota bacterium]